MENPSYIKDLVPDPANRRTHNPRNIGMVVDALQQVGAARSIVIDEHDIVLAGNGVVEGCADAGITKVKVIEADGDELIAVKRRGLTDEQKRALAMYDNRTAELAEWNTEQLKLDEAAGLTLEPFFYDNELAAIQTIAEAETDARAEWKGMPEFAQANEMPYKRLVVNFKNQAAVDDFARLIGQTLTARTLFVWHPAVPRAVVTEAYRSHESA